MALVKIQLKIDYPQDFVYRIKTWLVGDTQNRSVKDAVS